MKITNKPFIDNALKYGLIAGGASILLSLVYYLFEVNIFQWAFSILSFLISITISIVILLLGIKEYRLKYTDGRINYWTCFFQGFLILLVSGIVSALFTFLFYNYFDTEYYTKFMEKFVASMQDYNIPEDKLDEMITGMHEKMQPLNQLKSTLIGTPIYAAILSLILSAFAKKKNEDIFEGNLN